ncbi:MAG: hypothetical protein Q9203_002060 [Teloschistes exilis]
MYLDLVSLLVIAGLCTARPAQQPSSHLSLDMPMKGFPASELPRYTANNSLQGTLFPFADRTISQRIVYQAGQNQPDGPKLVANIAGNIYQFWRDTANLRIRWTYETRKQPFYDYKWIVTPRVDQSGRPSIILNPMKAGIVACRIMAGVIEQPSWAGHITASIWDSNDTTPFAQEVGDIDINNLPERAATAESNDTQPAVTARSQPLAEDQLSARAHNVIPVNVQRPWLRCFSTLYWTILTKTFAEKVCSDPKFPAPRPPQEFKTFRIPCGASGREIDLFLSPDAAPSSRTALTWDFLATEMLEWIAQVALGERRYDETWLIKNHEVLVGMIAIALGPIESVNTADSGTATA